MKNKAKTVKISDILNNNLTCGIILTERYVDALKRATDKDEVSLHEFMRMHLPDEFKYSVFFNYINSNKCITSSFALCNRIAVFMDSAAGEYRAYLSAMNKCFLGQIEIDDVHAYRTSDLKIDNPKEFQNMKRYKAVHAAEALLCLLMAYKNGNYSHNHFFNISRIVAEDSCDLIGSYETAEILIKAIGKKK